MTRDEESKGSVLDILQQLKEQIGPEARADEPMWRHTSFRVGGPAALFVRARRPGDLERLLPLVAASGVPWRILGGGTNVLAADVGIRGCVIAIEVDRWELRAVEERVRSDGGAEVVVELPAGCKMATVARRAVQAGLAGLEWAAGLPGTVGGAVVNNAGAHGSDVAAVLESVTAVSASGQTLHLSHQDMAYAYRASVLKREPRPAVAVLSARFRLKRGSREQLTQTAAGFEALRRQRQPTGLSAGSVFKNPPGDFAGRLVEMADLKGLKVGGAQVSTLHGNFFLNAGGATASDFYQLVRTVQDTVWSSRGVWLEPEIELLGEWTEGQRRALAAPLAAN